MTELNYIPRIKGKGFCPNPVARFGIPKHADAISYPKVVDTQAYDDWWNEQFYYCVNGYTTGGIFIPGRYYDYINFGYITTLGRGTHHPDFIDLDIEFYEFVEDIKKRNRGGIFPKGRRKGVSEKLVQVVGHGVRFNAEKYKAAVVAGLSNYSETFFLKFKQMNSLRLKEFQIQHLISNADEWIAGYDRKTENGIIQDGSFNQVFCRTMQANPNVLKGEMLNDCIFEEAGEFKILLKGYSATKACFQVGTKMVGTPYVLGTGGKITSSSKEFQEMWYDSDSYYLDRFPILGQRLVISYFIGSKNEKGELEEKCPNIRKMQQDFNLSDEQILGCEDTKQADADILERRKELSLARNKEPYWEHFLDFPRSIKEVFLKFTGNNFDAEAIATQKLIVDPLPESMLYSKYILTWKKNEKGEIIIPREVVFNPVSEEDLKDPTIAESVVFVRELPIKNFKDLDVAGLDSYDQDIAKTTKSLGAMVVLRRRGHPNKNWLTGKSFAEKRFPVCLIRTRPKRKEIFYDNCLKVAVAYNLRRRVMIDAGKPQVAKYFKDNSGEQFLSFRPRSFEASDSQQSHDYGMLLTGSKKSKSAMLGLAQTYVLDELDECWFPTLLDGFSDYDIEQTDSDWDDIDALGLALVCDAELRGMAKEEKPNEEDPFALPDWRISANGEYYDASVRKLDINNDSTENSGDLFIKMMESGKI